MDDGDLILLQRSPLFCDVDLPNVRHVLSGCPQTVLAAGDTLLEPGSENKTLFLVLDGQLRIYLSGRDLPAHTLLNPGECVGEMSVIDGRRVSALVIAAERTRLLAIDQEVVWSLVDLSYVVARNLLAILSGRIRFNNLALVSSQRQGLHFERAAMVDPLTGLHNKRWVEDAFPRVMSRCARDNLGLCLLLGNLDHFKQFTELHGNLLSDSLLCVLARRLSDILRPQDMLARFGVEEFVCLLPATHVADALKIAERMRLVATETKLAVDAGVGYDGVTMSLGIVPMTDGDSLEMMIASAENCLRRAKDAGRNRVEIAKQNGG